jgi:hypothetical protein
MSVSDAVRAADGIEGWLTEAQAARLAACAATLAAPAAIVEIGSFRGRSAVVLARAAAPGVTVTAIDPHAGNDRGPREIHGEASTGQADHEAFLANLEAAGVADRVRHVRRPSQEALGDVEGEIDLLYVDGAHRYRPARDDLALWGARVPPGGTLLVHDSFSSVGVTLAILRLLVAGGRFRYAGRTGSLAEYRREAVRGLGRAANAARQLAELGWFARNLAVKAAIVAGLRPVARLLGHRQGPWPY